MYRLYKKVTKSDEFPYGMRRLDESENPFLEGACILSALDVNHSDKDTNEAINRVLEFAKVRDYLSHENKLDLGKYPIRFLGIDYGEREDKDGTHRVETPYKEGTKEFTDKYFLPLISKDGKRISYLDAIKNLRNVNIVPYGDAAEFSLELMEQINQWMTNLKYSKDEIKNLLMQICVFPIETDINNMKKFKSTTLGFLDCNDQRVMTYKDPFMKDRHEKVYAVDLTNAGVVQVNGDGSHDYRKVYGQGRAFPAMISSAVIRALDNSMKSFNNTNSQSISLDYITSDYMDLLDMSEADIPRDVILKKIKPLEIPQKKDSKRKWTNGSLFNVER